MSKKKFVVPAVIILVLSGLFAIAGNYHWFGLNMDHRPADLPDAKEELRKLYSIYSRPDSSFNIKGMIRLFDRENKDALKEETPFCYSKQDMQFYSQLGYIQTFCTDSLVVQLDSVNKYIIVSKIDKRLPPASVPTGLPFEKFMQDTSTFKIEATVSEKNKERALTIKSELNPEIKFSTIFYDPVTYIIKRAEIEWWKEAVIYDTKNSQDKTWLTVMEYTYPAAAELSVAERVKKIITRENDNIVPGPAYKEYEIRVTF